MYFLSFEPLTRMVKFPWSKKKFGYRLVQKQHVRQSKPTQGEILGRHLISVITKDLLGILSVHVTSVFVPPLFWGGFWKTQYSPEWPFHFSKHSIGVATLPVSLIPMPLTLSKRPLRRVMCLLLLLDPLFWECEHSGVLEHLRGRSVRHSG
jgi:hypothetical protein